jgi:deoxycytidylate deaminase
MSSRIVNHLISSISSLSVRHGCYNGYIHYSGIYKNGKPLFLGCNHLRSTYNGECTCFSTHAEMDVLHKVLKTYTQQPFKDVINLKSYTIAVVRLGKDGKLKNSRPCNHCLETMIKFRIKKIMYSTDDGSVIAEKPIDMEKCHTSSGWNAFLSGRCKI